MYLIKGNNYFQKDQNNVMNAIALINLIKLTKPRRKTSSKVQLNLKNNNGK